MIDRQLIACLFVPVTSGGSVGECLGYSYLSLSSWKFASGPVEASPITGSSITPALLSLVVPWINDCCGAKFDWIPDIEINSSTVHIISHNSS